MKVRVYFGAMGESPDKISTVGMNNLITINDGRVKTARGLAKSLAECLYFHPHKVDNKPFLVLNDKGNVIGSGFTSLGNKETNHLYFELTKKIFAYVSLKLNGYDKVAYPILLD